MLRLSACVTGPDLRAWVADGRDAYVCRRGMKRQRGMSGQATAAPESLGCRHLPRLPTSRAEAVPTGRARTLMASPESSQRAGPGGGVRGCRLRGVLLGLSQFGHGSGEGDEVRDEAIAVSVLSPVASSASCHSWLTSPIAVRVRRGGGVRILRILISAAAYCCR